MIYALALLPVIAAATNSTMFDSAWAEEQYRFSLARIRASIAPKPDAFPGTIMASPTIIKPNPDYYYHWVRDSALTMECLAEVLEKTKSKEAQQSFYGLIDTFDKLTAQLQSLPIPDKFKNDKDYDQSQWLGEPKYQMNATPFIGDWGRPQNDGPASRAFATMRFVKHMLNSSPEHGARYWNTTHKSPLVVDLDYTAENWKKPSFEIWEEVKGNHFYTYMVQRRAMLDGAALAKKFNDKKLARNYNKVAKRIEAEIEKFWSPSHQYITVTKHRVAGVDYKNRLLDTQVVLAALHASKNDGFYTPENDKIHATWYRLVKVFADLYKDNRNHKEMAPAIGRYPEDQYNGYVSKPDGGNGWMLLTAGMAECLYRTREAWQHQKQFTVTSRNAAFLRFVSKQKVNLGETVTAGSSKFDAIMKGLVDTGDWFMQRVQFHTKGWHMSEQWNRDTGKQQGAEDLTWSYVAFVTAVNARERALQQ